MYIQGDVIIKKIDSIPEGVGLVDKTERGYVMAIGEATGHAHVIESDLECYEKDNILYFKNDKPVALKHEEHGTITIEPGIWKRGIVREFDAFQEESRNVQD